MKSMKKQPARRSSKEKGIAVAEDSQRTKAPGAQERGSANVQSANREEQGAVLRGRGQWQTGMVDTNFGPERGGPGAQQAGWSSRQQAERLQARGEQERLGESQQSGGGMAPTNIPTPSGRTAKRGSGNKQ